MCVCRPRPSAHTTMIKPWFTLKLRQLHQAKEEACSSGDRALNRQARNSLGIRVARRKASQPTILCQFKEACRTLLTTDDHPPTLWKTLTGRWPQHLLHQVWKFERNSFTPIPPPPSALPATDYQKGCRTGSNLQQDKTGTDDRVCTKK